MIIRFEGRDWTFSEEDITLQQGVAIHLAYGFTINEWSDALEHGDIRAMQCLYWLMLAQNGVTRPIRDCDCKIMAYMEAVAQARAEETAREAEEQAAAAAARPTSPPSMNGGPPSPMYESPTTMTPPLPGPPPVPATGY